MLENVTSFFLLRISHIRDLVCNFRKLGAIIICSCLSNGNLLKKFHILLQSKFNKTFKMYLSCRTKFHYLADKEAKNTRKQT